MSRPLTDRETHATQQVQFAADTGRLAALQCQFRGEDRALLVAITPMVDGQFAIEPLALVLTDSDMNHLDLDGEAPHRATTDELERMA